MAHIARFVGRTRGEVPERITPSNVTAAFAVRSYADTLTATVLVDPSRCPELPALTAGVQRELDVLTNSAREVNRGRVGRSVPAVRPLGPPVSTATTPAARP